MSTLVQSFLLKSLMMKNSYSSQTRSGVVKRTTLSAFGHIRTNGLIALSLREDDELIGVRKTSGNDDIIIASSGGKAVWFEETEVRPMGRTAAGVRGIFLEEGEVAVGMEMVTIESGDFSCYGKRVR